MEVENGLRLVVVASAWLLLGLFLAVAVVDVVLFVYGALLGHFFSQ